MRNSPLKNTPAEHMAYIITGPTSGIGHRTTLDVASHNTVVLVGRDREKLDALQKEIQQKGGNTVSVVCDLSDVASVQRAATEIVGLNLPLGGLVNNAGVLQMPHEECSRLGYVVRHKSPWALCANRSAHAASS